MIIMSIIISRQLNLYDENLEKELLKQIGNGQKSVFIKESKNIKELLNNSLIDIQKDFGQDVIDGNIKVQKKLGLVYLLDKDYNLPNRIQTIISMIPALKYIKSDKEVSTIDHVMHYGAYDIYIKEKKYHLSVVLYAEAI